MVLKKYICEVCKAQFDNIKEAEKHETIPITEYNYHGKIFKSLVVNQTSYNFISINEDKLYDEEHHFFYDFTFLDSVDFENLKKGKLVSTFGSMTKEIVLSVSGSEIKKSIESGSFKPISKEELELIKQAIERGSLDVLNDKTPSIDWTTLDPVQQYN